MLDTEQDEFTRQLSVLCAGFNVPLGDRGEAFWRAFRRLPLSEFARLVDAALTAGEIEKMPTVAALRALRKTLGTRSQSYRGEDLYTAMVAAVLARWRLSEAQLSMSWNWIVRDPVGPDCELIGVIVARDPADHERFPEHRLLVSEYRDAQHERAA